VEWINGTDDGNSTVERSLMVVKVVKEANGLVNPTALARTCAL
jgi:hypothetical protein